MVKKCDTVIEEMEKLLSVDTGPTSASSPLSVMHGQDKTQNLFEDKEKNGVSRVHLLLPMLDRLAESKLSLNFAS